VRLRSRQAEQHLPRDPQAEGSDGEEPSPATRRSRQAEQHLPCDPQAEGSDGEEPSPAIWLLDDGVVTLNNPPSEVNARC